MKKTYTLSKSLFHYDILDNPLSQLSKFRYYGVVIYGHRSGKCTTFWLRGCAHADFEFDSSVLSILPVNADTIPSVNIVIDIN